ncbi:MAG: DUF1579 family protein [bacterium]
MSELRSAGLARLEPLIGLWDTQTTRLRGSPNRLLEAEGSVEKSWTLGGLYLREDLAGVGANGEPLLGLGFLGHDAVRGRYQGAWLSTGATGLIHFHGWLEGEDLVLQGEEPDAQGITRLFRAVIVIEGPDRHTLTQSFLVRHRWVEAFRIVYTRAETDEETQ